MATVPVITVAVTAVPNKPTDGYRYERHDTEPTLEQLDLAWMLAREAIRRLYGLTGKLQSIDMSFYRSFRPGELELQCSLTVEPALGITLTAEYRYFAISLPHMCTVDMFNDSLFKPWFAELRRQLQTARYAVVDGFDDMLNNVPRHEGQTTTPPDPTMRAKSITEQKKNAAG